jgi:hypothetical protein
VKELLLYNHPRMPKYRFIYVGGHGLGSAPRPNGFRLNCENYHPREQFITTRVRYSCRSVSALGNVDGILS